MTFHKWFVGAFLTVFMVLALGVNAMLFSARNFQFNLAQMAPSTNGVISVNELMAVDHEIRQIQADTAQPRGALIQIEQNIAALDADGAAAQAQMNTARAEIAGEVATIETRVGAPPTQSASLLDAPALADRVSSLAARHLAPNDQQAVAALSGQVQHLNTLAGTVGERDAQRTTLVAQQRLVGTQVAEADRRIFALKQSVVPNYEQYDIIRSEVVALMNTSPLGIGAALVQTHPTFMSTLLVLLMGALGAILYLFPAYMSRTNPVTFAEIIVRMVFGMCTALAFYIVANATLAGFSFVPGQAAQGSAAMLNPFTVSLIGIIAGVMADDIARWIKNRGSELFGGQVAAAPPPATTATTSSVDPGFTGVNPHGGIPPV